MNKSLSSKCSSSKERKQTDAASKLRRLRIEENILLQNIKKIEEKDYKLSVSETTSTFEYKNTMKKLNDSYTKLKTLFDDIKTITNTQELLADVEIDEMKKKVMELEEAIKSCKMGLNNDLSSLKCAEEKLVNELEQTRIMNIPSKRPANISSVSLKQAVPSPVRLMMTSPLKCPEVQDFQEFMKNSHNRYGGWNEYHHNIFVTLWRKYFGILPITDSKELYADHLAFENFIEECLFKLNGIEKSTIVSHIEWYKIYLLLKSKQQSAIDKWKSLRKPLKTVLEKSKESDYEESNKKPECSKKCSKERSKLVAKTISSEDIERFTKPTKQWLSRCYEDEQKLEHVFDVESLQKLGIPSWRQYVVISNE